MGVTMITDGRGEVRVETGVGVVLGVEPKGERNVQVRIRADHLREHDLVCWVDRQGPIWPRVEATLKDPALKIWYRIDVHRQRNVPVEKPFASLANKEKVRDLVGLERPENAQVIDGAAPPPPAAAASTPPPAAARPPATTSRPAPAARPAEADPPPADEARTSHVLSTWCKELRSALRAGNTPPEEMTWIIDAIKDAGGSEELIDSIADECRPATGAAARRAAEPASPPPPPPPATEPPAAANGHAAPDRSADLAHMALAGARDPDRVAERSPNPEMAEGPHAGPRVSQTSGLSRRASTPIATDGRPWDSTNSDGRVNLGSYAAGAVLEFVNLAGRLLITRARQRAAEDPAAELRAPSRKHIFGLATNLINCADTVQHRMRDGGRVDRMSASHKVARQAVREALDLYPVPWGAEAPEREAWKAAVIDHATSLVTVTLDILEDRQQPTLVPAAPAEGAPPAQTG